MNSGTLITPLMLLLLAAVTPACNRRDPATPRPVAYPRIETADPAYSPAPGLPLRLEFNDATTVTADSTLPDGTRWLTVSYPIYGPDVRLFCTVSSTAPGVVDNRRERMSMNTGGAPTELTAVESPGGYISTVAVTPAGSATPVQFLAVGERLTVSGAVLYEAAATNPDSVRPVVEALRADAIHLAKTIR